MSTTDPRVLVPLLEELQECLRRGALESRDTLREADWAQEHLEEHCARLMRRVPDRSQEERSAMLKRINDSPCETQTFTAG